MIQLHYYPATASMVPHMLLEELQVPYERVLVDRAVDAHKSPAYLRLNPNGLIPALTAGDLVLYETAAICQQLCDTYLQGHLAPGQWTAAAMSLHCAVSQNLSANSRPRPVTAERSATAAGRSSRPTRCPNRGWPTSGYPPRR